jgi:chemotaxis response regulator CheB
MAPRAQQTHQRVLEEFMADPIQKSIVKALTATEPSECRATETDVQESDPLAIDGLCPIVGIGSSAGGLEAVTQMLQVLPPTTGMGYVLVQHLDPTHESVLAELLAHHTAMPVSQATQGTRVQPNHVYIIPPNSRMRIRQGILELTPREDRTRNLPIDFFFSSLAEDQRSRSIGVILSGAASDGTLGLEAIRAASGITFAQDASAKFDGMRAAPLLPGLSTMSSHLMPSRGKLPASRRIHILEPSGRTHRSRIAERLIRSFRCCISARA